MKNKTVWIIIFLSLVILSIIIFLILAVKKPTEVKTEVQPQAKTEVETTTEIQPETLPKSKIYLTIMGHIENSKIYTDCLAYPNFRQKLLNFAKVLNNSGYTMNLQISYEFFEGTLNCETTEMKLDTKGTNIIDFLANEYNFEIDAHHEGGWDWDGDENYADTKYIGNLLTSEISEVVGGVVWDNREQFTQLTKGEPGKKYPNFIWQPKIITAAVNHIHHLGNFSKDDPNSGVWIPAGIDEKFTSHDSKGKLIYVGSGPHTGCDEKKGAAFEDRMDYPKVLLNYINQGIISNQLLTVTIPLPQNIIFGDIQEIEDLIKELAQFKENTQVKIVTYSEVVEDWQKDYNSEPQIFFFEDIEKKDYTCE